MKKILFFLMAVLITGNIRAQFTKATIQASGLTCAMCSQAIENSLKQVSFIESIQADIKNSAFNIVFKKDQPVDIDVVKNSVEDAGFFVAKFSLTGIFSNIAVKNDEHIAIEGREYHFLNIHDQVLDGERSLVIVDKNFLTASTFKKYSAATGMQCIKTGKAGACCEKAGLAAGTRIYHVTI